MDASPPTSVGSVGFAWMPFVPARATRPAGDVVQVSKRPPRRKARVLEAVIGAESVGVIAKAADPHREGAVIVLRHPGFTLVLVLGHPQSDGTMRESRRPRVTA